MGFTYSGEEICEYARKVFRICNHGVCQVQVYSSRGSSQVQTKTDRGQGQGAGQEVSPARVDDRLDSTTKDNER